MKKGESREQIPQDENGCDGRVDDTWCCCVDRCGRRALPRPSLNPGGSRVGTVAGARAILAARFVPEGG
jgi:hypothetical protein